MRRLAAALRRCPALLGLVGLAAAGACRQRIAFDQGGCDQDSECGIATLHCDTDTSTCVECLADADCAALGTSRVRCDMASYRCIECGLDADCGQGRGCRHQHCVTLCNSEGMNAACPASAPYCESDDDNGFCIQCGDDLPQACSGGAVAGPFCSRLGTCVACQADTDCGPSAPRCDLYSGRCVACLSTADCGTAGYVCDPASRTCVDAS